MSVMTQDQITRARRAKQLYLVSFLIIVCVNGFLVLTRQAPGHNWVTNGLVRICWLATIAFGMFTTWRLWRSPNIGIALATVTTAIAPFCFMLELIILLRVYSKRTGIRLKFMMGDDASKQSNAA